MIVFMPVSIQKIFRADTGLYSLPEGFKLSKNIQRFRPGRTQNSFIHAKLISSRIVVKQASEHLFFYYFNKL